MEHRHLGSSGLKVSAIAYGNWVTHGNLVADDTATACVRRALDLGITTFDTADVYAETRAESVLGAALEGVRRESVELCTKVYWPTGTGENDRGLSRKHIIESAHGSMRRLRTDHIDLYQAHRYDTETPLHETMEAFADLVRQGKVLYIGCSEWTAEQIAAGAAMARELHIPFVSNQPQYSLVWRVIEGEVVPASRVHGLGQIVWSPLMQGVLTGKYLPGAPRPEGSRAAGTGPEADLISLMINDGILERVQQLGELAAEVGCTTAQLCLAWVLRNDNVASAIVGASRPEQLDENVGAVDVVVDDDLAARMEAIIAPDVIDDPAMTSAFAPTERP